MYIQFLYQIVRNTLEYINEKDCNQKRHDVNKSCLCWNMFESLNDWNVITLAKRVKITLIKLMRHLELF